MGQPATTCLNDGGHDRAALAGYDRGAGYWAVMVSCRSFYSDGGAKTRQTAWHGYCVEATALQMHQSCLTAVAGPYCPLFAIYGFIPIGLGTCRRPCR